MNDQPEMDRTERTEDVVKKGDHVKVKLIDRDERGRLRLSMKALTPKPETSAPSEVGDEAAGGEGEPVAAAAGSSESDQGGGGGHRDRSRGGRPRRGGGGSRGRRGGRGDRE